METNHSLEILINIVAESKTPGVLAYVYLNFVDCRGRSIVLNGCTLRKSKFNGEPYLMAASKSKGKDKGFYIFLYCADVEKWKEIEQEAIKKYLEACSCGQIPIIEEDGIGGYTKL